MNELNVFDRSTDSEPPHGTTVTGLVPDTVVLLFALNSAFSRGRANTRSHRSGVRVQEPVPISEARNSSRRSPKLPTSMLIWHRRLHPHSNSRPAVRPRAMPGVPVTFIAVIEPITKVVRPPFTAPCDALQGDASRPHDCPATSEGLGDRCFGMGTETCSLHLMPGVVDGDPLDTDAAGDALVGAEVRESLVGLWDRVRSRII
ncbi:MAG: hypothetical protein P8I44_11945 [Phycisphaerales bacterium]|nr:hypothetical protein [Phycisphaerales bacterium]